MQNFNTGTLAPWLDSRHDIDKYGKGLRLCRNFVVTPYGGLRRRAGTEYMREALVSDSRLISFQPTSEEGFIVEIGDGTTRIYEQGVLIDTLTSPWSSEDVYQIQFEQLNDIMFLVHRDHEPQQLSKAGSVWSLDDVDFDYPPFLDYELDGVKVAVTAGVSGTSTSATSINSDAGDAHDYSSTIPAGDYSINTTTKTGGTLKLELSLDSGNTWSTLHTITTTGMVTGSESVGLIRLHAESSTAVSTVTSTSDNANLSGGQAVTITATGNIFEVGVNGSQFEVTHTQDQNEVRLSLSGNGTSETLIVSGKYLVTTTGLWRGKITIEESFDAGSTWGAVTVREAFGDRNINYEGEQSSKALMRITFENTGSSANDPHVTLESVDATVTGRIKITGITSATVATGTIIEGVYDESLTEYWKHSAWSTKEGYPSAVCWHEQRLWYGGSKGKPSTLWASATEDFWNFKQTTLDDASFSRRIAANEQSDIRWLASQQYLFIGTSGAEWRGSSDSDSGVITPSSFLVRKFSSFGSAQLPAIITGSNMLYIQRQGRKVREISYELQSDGYSATDLTLLSIHSTQSGIRDVAYQSQRDSILWATLNCGRLIGLTYDKSQNVHAWHTHTTQGKYKSVATVYEQGDEDSVYCIVERDGVRMLERFLPEQYEAIEVSPLEDSLYMDSAVCYEGEAITELHGLDHLEGKTIQATENGKYFADYVVENGRINLDDPATKVKAGLAYCSLIETMPINFQTQQGATDGQYKRVYGVTLRVWRSVTAEFAPVQRHGVWQEIDQSQRTWVDLDPIADVDKIGCFEDWRIAINSGHDRDARCAVRINKPYPLNILSLQPKINMTQND